jgi:uncharacterized protein DUF4352
VYTVSAPGSPLALDDIRVRLGSLRWTPVTNSATLPPGMHVLGAVTLTVTNLGRSPHTVLPTQFWLLDAGRQEFLAQAGTHVAGGLIGKRIPPGASRTGTLVFPTPRRFSTGTVLVYRFADAAAIAHAEHVGLLRFG